MSIAQSWCFTNLKNGIRKIAKAMAVPSEPLCHPVLYATKMAALLADLRKNE
jgi:hypothetical protein